MYVSRINDKIFHNTKRKIEEEMHKYWYNNLLGEEISKEGYATIEIDELEIIGNNETIYWMLGFIDRQTKDARIYCVLNNRTKESLLPTIKDNILTININKWLLMVKTNKIQHQNLCVFQVDGFAEMGLILKGVNHSVWFCRGSFHTNDIEGFLSRIKKIQNNFSDISIELIKRNYPNDNDKKNYLNDYIAYILFLRDIEK